MARHRYEITSAVAKRFRLWAASLVEKQSFGFRYRDVIEFLRSENANDPTRAVEDLLVRLGNEQREKGEPDPYHAQLAVCCAHEARELRESLRAYAQAKAVMDSLAHERWGNLVVPDHQIEGDDE